MSTGRGVWCVYRYEIPSVKPRREAVVMARAGILSEVSVISDDLKG